MSTLKARRSSRTEVPTVTVGRVVALTAQAMPVVTFDGSHPDGVVACATAHYDTGTIGRAVALLFLAADGAQPVAVGLLPDAATGPDATVPSRIALMAGEEIVLQCGSASLTLTRAGKVLIRGTYVASRSSGMQRLTGAAVHIN